MSDEFQLHKYTGTIRSIRVGHDYKDAMVFTVGNTMKANQDGSIRYKITRITEDDHDNVVFGIQRFNVFGVNEGDSIEKIRHSFHRMPTCVQYDNGDM